MRLITIVIIFFILGCKNERRNYQISNLLHSTSTENQLINPEGNTVKSKFEVPSGYNRVSVNEGTFEAYLQNFSLKPDKTKVYLYNGQEKKRQDVHVAILDISVGDRDLQQCADATMRLRAEYLWQQKRYEDLHFNFTNGFNAEYQKWRDHHRIRVVGNKVNWVELKSDENSKSYASFLKFMETVFTYAGTLSLAKELPKRALENITIGDVFVQGGSPGHAVIVMDLAVNEKGEKVMLLAQSYMPAQDIHIIKNTNNADLNPWYSLTNLQTLETPEWKFPIESLKSWESFKKNKNFSTTTF